MGLYDAILTRILTDGGKRTLQSTATRSEIFQSALFTKSNLVDPLDQRLTSQLAEIEETFDALTAADVPTSDESTVQAKLTTYAETLGNHTTTIGELTSQLAEKTCHGIASGLSVTAQEEQDMTVQVESGVAYAPDGTRHELEDTTIEVEDADAVSPRNDIVYVDADGAAAYLAGQPLTAAIPGAREITITENAVAGDVVTFMDVVLTGATETPGENGFLIGSTIAETATNLAGFIDGHLTIQSPFAVTASENKILIAEKVAGGGNTPSEVTVTGTMAITQQLLTESTAAIVSVEPPVLPEGGTILAQINVSAEATVVAPGDIIDLRRSVLDMPYTDSDGNDSTVTRRLQEHDAALDTQAEAISANASQLDAIEKNKAGADELTGAYQGVDLTLRFASEIAAYGGDPWAWVKARVQAENFEGLHVHDFIPVTCANPGAYVLKPEIVGINTYNGSGSTEITSHIDWISKDCWPDTVAYNPAYYNNGIGMDKFVATAGQTEFQLARREAGYPALSSVTVNGTPTTDYTYVLATGALTYTGAALSAGAVVKAIWTTPITVPFVASNLYAYMNSLRMGVPNEAAADPLLAEVDYTAGGIYKFLPAALKAVISPKHQLAATRFTAGTLRTTSDNYVGIDIGPLWIPDEAEVCGSSMFATGTYDKWYSRLYPAFLGANRKKCAGNGGSRSHWWLFPAASAYSAYFCYVVSSGYANTTYASNTYPRVPVGFRIRKS